MNDAHVNAEKCAAEAELALRKGEKGNALRLYKEAADFELIAFQEVLLQCSRTRGIFGLSYASLLYKSRKLDEAERFIHQLLAEDKSLLLPCFRNDLQKLLKTILDDYVVFQNPNDKR